MIYVWLFVLFIFRLIVEIARGARRSRDDDRRRDER
jgi:hypothetical protein